MFRIPLVAVSAGTKKLGLHPLAKVRACPCQNPLSPIILAFWALWHCRHARPPDVALALI